MNVVCYGASVTAQKEQAGYYHALKQNFITREDIAFYQISFAASVFDQAGYSFMRSIEKTVPNPDICIIDWLTPGAVKFSEEKIIALSSYLLSLNCKPIWVNFPRSDDINNERECYQQVKTHCELFNIRFVDVYEDESVSKLPLDQILRDKVHTTPLGGQLYANVLTKVIDSFISSEQKTSPVVQHEFALQNIPFLLDQSFLIDKKHKVKLQFSTNRDLNFELFFLAEIGPFTPLIEVVMLNMVTNERESFSINVLDIWSHYDRTKCIKILRQSISAGEYRLFIRSLDTPAINDVNIKKPVDITKYPEGSELGLQVSQLSCNAVIEEIEFLKV